MKLLVDAMLGKLARYLRMCGHDAAYALDRGLESDEAILAAADSEDRVLVTRDVELAAAVGDAILVESKDIDGQLREVAAAGVGLSLAEPARCGRCNGPWNGSPPTSRPPSTPPTRPERRSGAVSTAASASGGGATGTTWPGDSKG